MTNDYSLSLMTAGTGLLPAPLLANIKYKAKFTTHDIDSATKEDLENLGSIYSAKLCEKPGEAKGCLIN